MVNNRDVSADKLILQNTAVRKIDSVTLVGDDDDRSSQLDVLAKPDISRDLDDDDIRGLSKKKGKEGRLPSSDPTPRCSECL